MKTTNKSLFSFTIFLAVLGCFTSVQTAKVQAQVITPDNTLGNENSVVNTAGIRDTINGGAIRGGNLFHSFQEFGISGGREAYFANPAGIQNILTRVTGGNPSNILGTLGVLGGNANLFLINPKGIQFGPNARLDVGGSFFASTADSLVFGNGFEFSASNTLAPPLLTVNTPIGLRFRDNPGNITNQSVVLDNTDFPVGLQSKQGNSLALVGGDVSVEQGGRLTAAGGRIELGGLAGAGTIGLDITGNTFKLNFPANSLLSNVSLINDARVAVRGNGGGDIVVNSNIFTATNGGRLVGGIEGVGTKNGGDITINSNEFNISGVGLQTGFGAGIYQQVASGSSGNAGNININTKSFNASLGAELRNTVNSGGTGNAGNIELNANNLTLNNATISASNFGQGNAGNVILQARNGDVNLVGSAIFSAVETGGSLFSEIKINAPQGSIFLNNSTLSVTNSGTGFAGNIFLNARDLISVSSRNIIGPNNERTIQSRGKLGQILIGNENSAPKKVELTSVSFSATNDSIGSTTTESTNAGIVSINALESISLNSSFIETLTRRLGNAGNVTLQARNGDISLVGGSTIFSTVETGGIGNAGEINVTARNLSLLEGAQMQTLVRTGQGNAGNINIKTTGNVSFSGFRNTDFAGEQGFFPSGILSNVFSETSGNAGNIDISASSIFLGDRAVLISTNNTDGFAGNIKLNAREQISLANQSSIFSNGFAGRVFITSDNNSVNITDSSVSTTSIDNNTNPNLFSEIRINAPQNSIFLNNSNLSVTNSGTGFAGNILLNARDLISIISPNFVEPNNERTIQSRGKLGRILIGNENLAPKKVELTSVSLGVTNDSVFTITTDTINSGIVSIYALDNISLNNSLIETSTNRLGNAGNVTLQAKNGDITFANGSAIFSTVEAGGRGDAGEINVTARNLSLFEGAQMQTLVRAGQGNAGNINIKATDNVSFSGFRNIDFAGKQGFFPSGVRSDVFSGTSGNAGNIDINASSISLSDRAELISNNNTDGFAGNIKLNAREQISLATQSGIFSNGFAGRVSITSDNNSVNITDSSVSTESSDNNTNSGLFSEIKINAPQGSIFLNNSTLSVTNSGTGFAGNIFLNARDLISVSSRNIIGPNNERTIQSRGKLGQILIGNENSAPKKVELTSVSFSATNDSIGSTTTESTNAGIVSINALESISLNSSFIETLTRRLGNAGNVTLQARNGDISLVGGSTIFSTVETGGIGNAGEINVTARNLSLLEGSQMQTLVRTGQGNAGNINIKTTGNVSFSGFRNIDFAGEQGFFPSGILSNVFSETSGNAGNEELQGNGGNINITAKTLSLTDSALIQASTFGIGKAGGIVVRTDDAISLANSSQIRSSVEAGGEGNAGNIDIRGRSLTLTGGSQIGAVVFRETNGIPGGIGKAGNISINTTDFVNISGVSSGKLSSTLPFGFSSGIFASAERGTTATVDKAAGNIIITTNDFRIADGAVVNALTSNTGDGGSININANIFTATGGGQIITTTRDIGNAGDITLKITDRISIDGSDPNYNQRLEEASKFRNPTDIVNNQGAKSGIFASTAPGSTGNGGNIFIDPKIMVVSDGAGISGNSAGTGNAGNIEVVAGTLTLDKEGFITTASSSGQGGKITITANDLLLLRRKSQISTSAGSDGGSGSGGNIDINAGVLVAFPRENSDITADSFGGRGGNINIKTRGVFGIQVRPQRTELSDITARSEKDPQLSGQINLTNEVNPSQALVELPENVTNRTDQIARNPCQEGIGNEYIETGRGGLPTNPNQPLSSGVARVDLVNLAPNTGNTTASNTASLNNSTDKKIVPAQGWVTNEKGQVVLTAYDPTGAGVQRTQQNTAVCPSR
ncbi:MAG: filamentous hemagglutinin N-terminal domain-containing protein [Scytonematopsis contorta HA4267-MV1]|jgi:filamentous hemagglutinin family protein|nr:filamentous hemagglutinin N-terminal domain-containing protein [Scytonematopsis contorta HA4267-MV1]